MSTDASLGRWLCCGYVSKAAYDELQLQLESAVELAATRGKELTQLRDDKNQQHGLPRPTADSDVVPGSIPNFSAQSVNAAGGRLFLRRTSANSSHLPCIPLHPVNSHFPDQESTSSHHRLYSVSHIAAVFRE